MKIKYYYNEDSTASSQVQLGTFFFPCTTWENLANLIENTVADEVDIVILSNPSQLKIDTQLTIPSNVKSLKMYCEDKKLGMIDLAIVNDAIIALNPNSNIEVVVENIFFKNSRLSGQSSYSSGVFAIKNNNVDFKIEFINSFVISGVNGDNNIVPVWNSTSDFDTAHIDVFFLGNTIENDYIVLNQCTGTNSTTKVLDSIIINNNFPLNPLSSNTYWDGCEFSKSNPGWAQGNLGNNIFTSQKVLQLPIYSTPFIANNYFGIEQAYYNKIKFESIRTSNSLPGIDGGTRVGPGALFFSGEEIYVDLEKTVDGTGAMFDPLSGDQFLFRLSEGSLTTIPYAAVFKLKGFKAISKLYGNSMVTKSDVNYFTFKSWGLHTHQPWGLIITGTELSQHSMCIITTDNISKVDLYDFAFVVTELDSNFAIKPCSVSGSNPGSVVSFYNSTIHDKDFNENNQSISHGILKLDTAETSINFYGSNISVKKILNSGGDTAEYIVKDSIVDIRELEVV